MKPKRSTRVLAGACALVMCSVLALATGGVASAKKAKKALPKTVTVSNANARPIPDRPPGVNPVNGRLDTRLTVSKKFKGQEAETVTVTFQTTGDSADAASDLGFILIAPNGRLAGLGSYPGQSIGPLTVSPNSSVLTCGSVTPPCSNPLATLNRPFAGTANAQQLAWMDGVPMRGTWTVSVLESSNTATSTLDRVSLKITRDAG